MLDHDLLPSPDAEEALLARLELALAPTVAVAVEPPADGFEALRAAVRAEWEPRPVPTRSAPSRPTRSAPSRPVAVRPRYRHGWRRPGVVLSTVLGTLVLGSGVAFAAGAPIPRTVRTVANEMGLPIASPAVATARQATSTLHDDLQQLGIAPAGTDGHGSQAVSGAARGAAARAAQSLANQLGQLDPQQRDQVGGQPDQLLQQACQALYANGGEADGTDRPAANTPTYCLSSNGDSPSAAGSSSSPDGTDQRQLPGAGSVTTTTSTANHRASGTTWSTQPSTTPSSTSTIVVAGSNQYPSNQPTSNSTGPSRQAGTGSGATGNGRSTEPSSSSHQSGSGAGNGYGSSHQHAGSTGSSGYGSSGYGSSSSPGSSGRRLGYGSSRLRLVWLAGQQRTGQHRPEPGRRFPEPGQRFGPGCRPASGQRFGPGQQFEPVRWCRRALRRLRVDAQRVRQQLQ